MIDKALMKQLGWSEELIDAALTVAQPMRQISVNTTTVKMGAEVKATACSAIYAISAVGNTLRELTVNADQGNTAIRRR